MRRELPHSNEADQSILGAMLLYTLELHKSYMIMG